MKTIDAIADWMAPPKTFVHGLQRALVLMVCGLILIEAGHWTGMPISLGAMFGYAWGSLTTYGACRRCMGRAA